MCQHPISKIEHRLARVTAVEKCAANRIRNRGSISLLGREPNDTILLAHLDDRFLMNRKVLTQQNLYVFSVLHSENI